MIIWLILIFHLTADVSKRHRNVLLENLALRHQLPVLSRGHRRPRLTPLDRALWMWLSHTWSRWKEPLRILQPDTVLRWHRAGFRLFWRWRSRSRRVGRTAIAPGTINLIRQMSRANPLWGAPQSTVNCSNLATITLGTVAKYMVLGPHRPCSQTRKTFLRNHLGQMVSVDFFTFPTLAFQVFYVSIVLLHHRRKVLHFKVVGTPSAAWAGQQLRGAFPFASPWMYLLRDRDGIYGLEFQHRAQALGSEEVRIAPRSPW